MQKIYTVLSLMLLALFMSGCNTISGAGQDIEAVGEAVEEVAEDTKDEMTDDD